MTRDEWLASGDPWAMLRWLTTDTMLQGAPGLLASDRKLRLFACACCWGVSAELGKDAEQCMEWQSGPAKAAAGWAMAWAGDQKKPAPAERAALLREVVGDPWRPATWACVCCGARAIPGHWTACPVVSCAAPCPWRTQDVLSLAHAAYEDRPGRRCGKCHGSGTYAVEVRNAALSAANGYGTATTYSEWRGCRHCGGDHDRKGTGRTDDGALDPVRCGILSDALEEAGADEGLVAHLRSPGPHVRGCWALDLVLGKE